MIVLLLFARVLLAGVFVLSAVAKLRDRVGARKAVQDFGVPSPLVPVVATSLPFVELACAAALLSPDPGATAGAVASALLLSAFSTAIAANLLRGRQPDCHCFGQLDTGPTGWLTVGRNGVLLVLALLPVTRAGHLRSVPATVAAYNTPQITVGLVLTGLALAVAVLGLFCRALLQRYGSVLLRLEALEAAGPPPPRQAPGFALPDLEGTVVRLEDVLAENRPVFVAFISPTCSMCGDLVPDLERWQADGAPLAVTVLSTGSAADNRAKIGAGSKLRILLQQDWEVAEAYLSNGTPCAYLVGVDGFIAGEPAYGVDAVRQLHNSVAAAITGEPEHVHQIGRRPVDVGDTLPDITAQIESGEDITLAELSSDEVVLLFWRTTCGFCAAITGSVAALEGSARVVLVTGSDVAEIRGSGLSSPLIRDPGSTLNEALQIPGTPAAVRVIGGTVASHVAVGGPEVLALLSRDADRQKA